MPFDPEAFREKQERRKQLQEKRKEAQRKLRVRLIIAGAILMLLVLAVFLLTRGGDTQPEATQPETSQPVTEQTQPTQITEDSQMTQSTESAETTQATEPKDQDTVIHIAAAGDLNITDSVVAAGGAAMDYSRTFMDVAHLFADADVAVLNLEGNLVGDPYGGTYYSAPQSMMQALNDAGVDLVQLANSYSIRNGMSGLGATIDAIRASGMEPVGAYATQEDFEESGGYTLVDVKGIRIAFVAFTKGMDGMTLPSGNEDCVNILYTDYDMTYQEVNYEKIDRVLTAVSEEEPDLVVALLHWGSEFNDTISSSQEAILAHMQDRGVDAVIGTHSHYVQKMQYDPQTGSFFAYSLGDFFGDASRSGSEYSVVLDLEVTKDKKTGKCRITDFGYTPIFTVTQSGKYMRVVRIQEAMRAYENGFIDKVSESTYNAMEYALERIEARIKGE